MAKPKKLGLDALLASKANIDNSTTKEYFVESLNGVLDLEKINPRKMSDNITKINDGEDQFGVYQEIIYACCPLLRNKELLVKFEVAEPYDIVGKILTLAEVLDLGNQIIQWYGFNINLKK